mmetsp:Transcript_87167/g.247432  ORF Transcript_87167/g.247432 Transcript_87167/m.247432 type:complete len:121 (-) Transcript_87167:1406-1768(-)
MASIEGEPTDPTEEEGERDVDLEDEDELDSKPLWNIHHKRIPIKIRDWDMMDEEPIKIRDWGMVDEELDIAMTLSGGMAAAFSYPSEGIPTNDVIDLSVSPRKAEQKHTHHRRGTTKYCC